MGQGDESIRVRDSTLPGKSSNLSYRPDVDGLRAIAVLSVVIFHGFPAAIPGGFVGVDIFFVISGFLITGILREELAAGKFSIVGFYERRVRRIFPALFAMLAITTVLAVFVLAPNDLRQYFDTLLGATLFTSNFVFWFQSGYFDTSAELKPLLHTWSLAVEEQFYIFFPPMLWVLWRFRLAAIAVWLGLVASFVFALFALRHHADMAYYLIPSRAWELLIGSIISLKALPDLSRLPSQTRKVAGEVIAVAGLALILVGFAVITPYSRVPGYPALMPCAGAACLIYAGVAQQWPQGGNAVGRLLSWRPMVWVGLVSYSLYLWHWPLLALARYVNFAPLSAWQTVGVLAVTAVAAECSRLYVERPFRKPGHGNKEQMPAHTISAAKVVLVGICVIVLFIAVGAAGSVAWRSKTVVASLYGPDMTPIMNVMERHVSKKACTGSVQAGVTVDCRIGRADKPATMALWGDSVADSASEAFDDLDTEHSMYRFIQHSCPPILGTTRIDKRPEWVTIGETCRAFNESVIAELERRPEIQIVVIMGLFAPVAYMTPDNESALIPDGYAPGMSNETLREKIVEKMVGTIRRIRALGKTVAIVGSYEIGDEISAAAEMRRIMQDRQARQHFGVSLAEFEAATELFNSPLRELDNQPGIVFIDPKAIFCPDAEKTGWCQYDQGLPLISDGTHFTEFGAKRLLNEIRGRLAADQNDILTP